MRILSSGLILWGFLVSSQVTFRDYCDISPNHLLCGGDKGYDDKCGKIVHSNVTEEQRKEYLHYINELRNDVAFGALKGGTNASFPRASNMEELVWDDELALLATAKVKRCDGTATSNNQEYQSEKFGSVHENDFLFVTTDRHPAFLHFRLTIRTFINARRRSAMYYDPQDVDQYPTRQGFTSNSFGINPGYFYHLTGLLYGESKFIGCDRGTFGNQNATSASMICYLSPGGNVMGERIYKRGDPCSNCTGANRRCSRRYPGLCENTPTPTAAPMNLSAAFNNVYQTEIRWNYCELYSRHAFCNSTFDYHERCGNRSKIVFQKLTSSQKRELTRFHNSIRNSAALGETKGGTGKLLYTAANMEEVVWDDELEDIAGFFVRNCLFAHTTDRDTIVTIFGEYPGENLAVNTKTLTPSEMFNEHNAYMFGAYGWSFEAAMLDREQVKFYRGGSNSLNYNNIRYGHFTQMVWASTTRVGCAQIAYEDRNDTSRSTYLFACHYIPGGNVVNRTVYEVGKPCSKCPGIERQCSKKFIGLCANKNSTDTEPDPDTGLKLIIASESTRIWLCGVTLFVCLSIRLLLNSDS